MNSINNSRGGQTATLAHPITAQLPIVNFFKPALQMTGNFAPNFSGWLGYNLMCRPTRRKFGRREQAMIGQAWQWTIRFQNKPLHIYSWGEGPVVLFVHGWTDNGGVWWRYVAPLVDAGYRVITFDAPAHGHSAGSILTPLVFSRALKAVQQEVGTPYAVVSHSLGALTAMMAYDTALDQSPMPLPQKLVLLSPFTSLMELYDYCMIQLGFPHNICPAVRAYAIKNMGRQIESFTAANTVRHFHDTDVMVVSDDADVLVPATNARTVALSAPNGRFLLTSGLGHALKNGQVVQSVISFVGY